MKKKISYLFISLLLIHCAIFFPITVVSAEGGQVSVPSRISFETDTKSSENQDKENINEANGTKEYAYLPKTGETKHYTFLLGSLLLTMFATTFIARKKVNNNEKS